MSSLEITAAPWRSKARSVSVLPAPIPPVIATAMGRFGVLGVFVRRRRILAVGVARPLLFRSDLIRLEARVDFLGRKVRPLGRRLAENFFGEP